MKEVAYTWSGDHITIDVPDLNYWSMLIVDRDPKQSSVQKLFE